MVINPGMLTLKMPRYNGEPSNVVRNMPCWAYLQAKLAFDLTTFDLIGPPCPVVSKQSKIPNGITTNQFVIDIDKQIATCPAGFSTKPDYGWKGKIRFHFPDEVCAVCLLRECCCVGTKGRTLCVGLTYPLLQEAHRRQKTDTFKADYHKHRSGVEGCVPALARGMGCASLVMLATENATCKLRFVDLLPISKE